MTIHGDMVMQFGGMPVGEIVQGNTYFVDNSKSAANDNNTGRNWKRPKATIQSAIDEAKADRVNGGHRIYIMGSSKNCSYPWSGVGFHAMTGSHLYGVYREKLDIDADCCGMQLIGLNYPFISGNEGATQDLTGHTPTIQIGTVGVDSDGPLYVKLRGLFVGGYGDDGDDATNNNAYGAAIAIGEFDDVNYNDGVYFTEIDDCLFRSSNDMAGGQTNDEEIHCWIKGWGNEKIRVRRCSFWGGQYQIGMLGSSNNNPMMWEVDDCNLLWAKTAAVYSPASALACTIRRTNIAPSASGKELYMTGGTASALVDCSFPLCADAGSAGLISAASLGTFTGWAVINGKAQAGVIYDKD